MATRADQDRSPALEQRPLIGERSEFLAQLLSAIPHAIVAIGTDDRITYWNEQASSLYGYTAQQMVGRPFRDLIANGEVEAVLFAIRPVWLGRSWSGGILGAHCDGTIVPIQARATPLIDAFHSVSGIALTMERIPQFAGPSRPFAECVESTSLDAVWQFEVSTGEFSGNEAYHNLIGPTPLGQSPQEAWLSRIHPADLPLIRTSMLAAEDGQLTFRREYRILDFQSKCYVQILDHGIFVRNPEGRLLRVAGVLSDMGRQREIERAIRASEDRFRLVFEESPIGSLIVDRMFQIQQTNRAFRQLLGYSDEELLGRSIIDFTHPADQESCATLSSNVFVSKGGFFRIEKRYVRRDGGTVWVAVTATALPGGEGSPPLGLALIEDVTGQKRDQEELCAANARVEAAMNAKMRFLAQISHEIRSPMNGVLGMLELLDGSPLQPDQRDCVLTARQAATSLLGMLEEILDLTRLDEQRLSLHFRDYDPRQLLQDLTALYRVPIASKQLSLIASYMPGIPVQHVADPARVRQILINLLENAIKFTTDGHVGITLSATDAALCYTVEDTGLGIPADAVDSIFEAFSAASAVTSASIGGTGLGLAISQRLARLMGGDITASSTVGVGSRFTLSLPLTAGVAGVAEPAVPISAFASFPGRQILVVEDNLINQRVSVGILRRLDCEVDLAANGVEGLNMAMAKPYDVIFMDAMMPVMDGFEATLELRRREPAGRRVPIIGLTALATDEDRLRCLAAGMDDYLPKPADSAALSAVLQRWLPALRPSVQ